MQKSHKFLNCGIPDFEVPRQIPADIANKPARAGTH